MSPDGKAVKLAALLVLAAVVAGTMLFARHLENFSLDATTDSLVLQSDPDLEFYNSTRRIFGSDEYIIVAFNADNVLSPENVKFTGLLSTEMKNLDGVERVVSLTNAPLFRSPLNPNLMKLTESLKNPMTLTSPGCDLELAAEELRGHSIFGRNIISDDAKTTAMLVYFAGDPELDALDDEIAAAEKKGAVPQPLRQKHDKVYRAWKKQRRDTVGDIRTVLAKHTTTHRRFYASGVPIIVNDMVTYIRGDLWFFGTGAAVFLFAGLFVMFRRLRWVILPMATCLIVVIWIIGMMASAGKPTTVVTSNLSSLLFIVAMAHSIHLIIGYQEAGAVPSHGGRVFAAMRRLITPCFYTAATTAVGFASLIICDIQPVKDFGIYMSIGVGLALLVSFTFFPALLLLLGGRGLEETKHHLAPGVLGRLAGLAVRRRLPVAVLTVALVIVSIFGIVRISTETRFIDYFRKDSDIYTGLEFIDNNMGGTTSLEIILRADKAGHFKDPKAIAKLKPIHEFLNKQSETGKVISLVNFGEELDKVLAAAKEKLGPLGAMLRADKVVPAILQNLPPDLLRSYVSEDFATARIFIRVRESTPKLFRNKLIKDIRAFLMSRDELKEYSPRLSGIFLLYTNMLNSLVTSQVSAFWVVFAAIYVMFLVLFRSPQVAAYAMIPNVLPVMTVLGIMGFTGVHLDMMTIMIASVSLGIGADGAIHYIFRYRKELEACGDIVEAVHRSHASIGRAILFTSIVVVVGFWFLVFSNFTPTVYFGLFTGLTMLAALASSLILLPLCLVTFKPLKPKK